MSYCIIDCSVAVSWFMPDENCDTQLLTRIAQNGAIVPSLWFLEIGNVLLMAQRRKRITLDQRYQAITSLKELPIVSDNMTSYYAWLETMSLADRFNLTLYDASYLELALRIHLPLLTYDKQLIQAAKMLNITT